MARGGRVYGRCYAREAVHNDIITAITQYTSTPCSLQGFIRSASCRSRVVASELAICAAQHAAGIVRARHHARGTRPPPPVRVFFYVNIYLYYYIYILYYYENHRPDFYIYMIITGLIFLSPECAVICSAVIPGTLHANSVKSPVVSAGSGEGQALAKLN